MTHSPRYIDLFLEALASERGCSHNTLEAYGRDVRKLLSYTQKDLDTITSDDVRHFLSHLHRQALDPRSIARCISSLRQCFQFLFESKKISWNPMQDIALPVQGRSLPKTLTRQEVCQLIDGAYQVKGPEGLRLVCFLELLYASGLRVSELVALPLGNIMSGLRSDADPLPLPIIGKGKKERIILISATTQKALRAYLAIRPHFLRSKQDANPFLFASRGHSGHLTRQRVGQLLKDLCVEIGLPPSKVSPHILRHAFATHMLDQGADLLSLQKLLGHSDLSTTEIYTHIQPEKLLTSVATHHPLSKTNLRDT